MDIADTIKANSEQVNAEDLLGGPVTARITSVERGSTEQPVFIHTDAFEGRTYRPAKSMRRLLVAAWGPEASVYVDRYLTLYNDPTVKWAGQEVGGVRISALSHIHKPLTVALSVSRGKRVPFTVQPLDVTPNPAIAAAIETLEQASSLPALKTAWDLAATRGVQSHPDVVAVKERRKQELGES